MHTLEEKLDAAKKYIALMKEEKNEFLRIRSLAEQHIKMLKNENEGLKKKVNDLTNELTNSNVELHKIRKLTKSERTLLKKDLRENRLKLRIKKLNGQLKQLEIEKERLIIKLHAK